MRTVRITLHRPVREFFADLFSNPAYQPIPLSSDHVFDADELRFTRDPFDALLLRRRARPVATAPHARHGDSRVRRRARALAALHLFAYSIPP
jgi:PIN domain nuclease of toxin-antitoxin system